MREPDSIEGNFPTALSDLVLRNTTEVPPDLDAFHSAIDDSDYSLGDWTEALIGFDDWLAARSSGKRPFNMMVGYISCCTMVNSASIALPSLNAIVNQSLTEHGFDAGN